MLEFISKARADKKPLVYIGFGSIVVQKPKAMTRSIVKAVLKSDVRAILNKGWSARMAEEDDEPEVQIPPEVYEVRKSISPPELRTDKCVLGRQGAT